MVERNAVHVGARSIIEQDNKILFIRRSSKNSFCPDMWDLPGGHVDPNEPVSAGAIRETKEEVGVDMDIEDMSMLLTVHRKRKMTIDAIEFYFRINKKYRAFCYFEKDELIVFEINDHQN